MFPIKVRKNVYILKMICMALKRLEYMYVIWHSYLKNIPLEPFRAFSAHQLCHSKGYTQFTPSLAPGREAYQDSLGITPHATLQL